MSDDEKQQQTDKLSPNAGETVHWTEYLRLKNEAEQRRKLALGKVD